MEIRILGPLEVLVQAVPVVIRGRHHPKILALLLAEAGQVIPMRRLIDALWDDEPPDTAYQQVQNIVGALRRQLGEDGHRLQTFGQGYRLEVATEELDLLRCKAAAADSRTLREAGRLDEALTALQSGLAEWRGPALAGLSGRLVEAAAQRLNEYQLSLVEERVDLQLELGGHSDLIGELQQLTAEHPLRQRLTAQLMLALHRTGRTPEALQMFTDASAQLADILGIDPGQPLRDLHTAILREDPDLMAPPKRSVAPPDGHLSPAPALLPADIAAFTGRSEHLDTLDSLLGFDSPRTRLTVLTGTGGIGKTTLALHWAHRVADQFPDGQLYVNLRGFDPGVTAMTPNEALMLFLDALGVTRERLPSDPDAQIGLYRSLLADRRVLVVIDNSADSAQVRPLLPSGPDCFTVVTSRDQLSGLVAAQCAHPIAIRSLDTGEACDLLEPRIGKQRMADDPEAVTEIIDSCGGLPLALAITAARIATHPNFPLQAISDQLRDSRNRLDAFSGNDPVTDVRSVFSWSYRSLGDEAARMFRLLALHPGPDISAPASASLAGIPPQRAGVALQELNRTHLIVEDEPGRYSFHDLLRSYANELVHTIDTEDDRRTSILRMLDHYLYTTVAGSRLLNPHQGLIDSTDIHPEVVPETIIDHGHAMNWFSVEFPVLAGVIRLNSGAEFDAHIWQLGVALAQYILRQGHRHESLAVLGAALVAAERRQIAPGQIRIHRYISRMLTHLNEPDLARHHLEQALALCSPDDQHPLAQIHLDFSRMYGRSDRYAEALHHGHEALVLFQEVGRKSDQGMTFGNIGWYQAKLGNFEDALHHCEQALALHEEAGAPGRQASVWDSIGYIHHRLSHHTLAIECYRKALQLSRDAGLRSTEAEALKHLGDVYATVDDTSAARQSWQQALRIYEEIGSSFVEEVREKLGRLDRAE